MQQAELGALYDAHFRRVYNYISYRLNDHSQVDDLVSTVFLRVIDRYAQYDPRKGPVEGWIIGIARNAITDHYRERAKLQAVDIEEVANLLPDGETPEVICVRNEDHLRLIGALSTLAPRERDVIALKYGAELGHRQIARQLNLSLSNVGVILFRSLRKLRTELGKEVSS